MIRECVHDTLIKQNFAFQSSVIVDFGHAMRQGTARTRLFELP
jgi:hypothetical protein